MDDIMEIVPDNDIGVTMNTYTHLGLEDAKDEMIRLEELNAASAELNKTTEKHLQRRKCSGQFNMKLQYR